MNSKDYTMILDQPGALQVARVSRSEGSLKVKIWLETKEWARNSGWKTPLFGFRRSYLDRMLENEKDFRKGSLFCEMLVLLKLLRSRSRH
ncbi:MAG: hypothetical protein AAGB46_00005 [Verrucomicrobiota bacterium]